MTKHAHLALAALLSANLLAGAQGFDLSPDDAGVGVKIPEREAPKKIVKTITETALTHDRIWQSVDGKKITGALLAHHPAEGKPAPKVPIAVRDGIVRLLVNKKTFDLPLEKLSENDRKFVAFIEKKMADAAKAGTLKKEGETKGETPAVDEKSAEPTAPAPEPAGEAKP